MSNYLESAKKQFGYYRSMGLKTIDQIPDDKLFWSLDEESNSIYTIVKHLKGNMLSRWTDFLTTDGEKEWRERDDEFENDISNRAAIIQMYNKGWECLFSAMTELKEEDLEKQIFIRNIGQSVTDAINRQLCHYAYHVGQMVFIGKMIKSKGWKSLSIPKGESKSFNKKSMGKS